VGRLSGRLGRPRPATAAARPRSQTRRVPSPSGLGGTPRSALPTAARFACRRGALTARLAGRLFDQR